MAEDWSINVKKYSPEARDTVIAGIVSHCGIALQSRDASLVSFTDSAETDRVRESFLKKKLGLTQDNATLDAAIAAVGERMKGESFRNRVTVYYLLAEHFDLLSLFDKTGKGTTEGAEEPAVAADGGGNMGVAGIAAAGLAATGAAAAGAAGTVADAVSGTAAKAAGVAGDAGSAIVGGAAAIGAAGVAAAGTLADAVSGTAAKAAGVAGDAGSAIAGGAGAVGAAGMAAAGAAVAGLGALAGKTGAVGSDAVGAAGAAISGVGAGAAGAAKAGMDKLGGAAAALPFVGEDKKRGGLGWLLWVLLGLLLLAFLWWLFNHKSGAPAGDTSAVASASASDAATGAAPAADASAAASEPASAVAPAVAPDGAGVHTSMRDGDIPVVKVYFATGKAAVVPAFGPAAASLKDYLGKHAGAALTVSGYADKTGNAALNAALSKRRAQAVQAALEASGIPAASIALVKPADDIGDQTNNVEARRVEVNVK